MPWRGGPGRGGCIASAMGYAEWVSYLFIFPAFCLCFCCFVSFGQLWSAGLCAVCVDINQATSNFYHDLLNKAMRPEIRFIHYTPPSQSLSKLSSGSARSTSVPDLATLCHSGPAVSASSWTWSANRSSLGCCCCRCWCLVKCVCAPRAPFNDSLKLRSTQQFL